MRVVEIPPGLIYGAGALLGAALGWGASRAADALPARYGIVAPVARRSPRRRRPAALVALSVTSALAIAHVLGRAPELSAAHAAFLLAVNAACVAVVLAAAAVDIDHMILPDELTLGGLALCVASSPLRAIGTASSIGGALAGFLLAYVPFVLYKRLRGRSGMGLGDAKLTAMAGAWHGVEGSVFVLLAGAVQLAVAAMLLRALAITPQIPESVAAEIAALKVRADAGDAGARRALADDPMAAPAHGGMLGMRLPLGPFLALGCIEVLFLRRWLVEHVVRWLAS